MPEEGKKAIVDRVSRRLRWLDAELARKPYLLGDSYSVADAYAFTVLGWSKWVKLDLSPYAHIIAYMDRIGARPAVKEALEKEGLTAG
jgi:glutathione S-transferase